MLIHEPDLDKLFVLERWRYKRKRKKHVDKTIIDGSLPLFKELQEEDPFVSVICLEEGLQGRNMLPFLTMKPSWLIQAAIYTTKKHKEIHQSPLNFGICEGKCNRIGLF